MNADDRNTSSHPPLWRWKPSSLGRPAPPGGHSASERHLPRFPGWRSSRKRLWVEIWFHGGPELNHRIATRGWVFDFPGQVPIDDVVRVINGQAPLGYVERPSNP